MSLGKRTYYPTEKTREYIDQILETGRLSYGPFSKRFEQEFAELHDTKFAVLSNSGTSSLLVALETLKEVHGWQDGDEVIVPALTFVATVNVVLQAGLKPVLADIEPDYYGMIAERFRDSITDKTKCVIPVHTFGQPCNMNFIYDVAKKAIGHEVFIVEDSCESMFVNHHNKPVGSWSDIACFSTYVAHLITTGVGGIAVTDNPDYARIMRSYVNHGIDDSQPMALSRDFAFSRIGHSFRITELEAAIGLAQLEDWQEMIKARQHNAKCLTNALSRYYLQLPQTRPHTGHAFMMYPIVCRQEGIRDKLCQFLNENNIGTRKMLPLVNQPCYKGLWDPDDYPVAQWIDRNGFYIGCHQNLTTDDLDYVIAKFGEFLDAI